IVAERAGNRRAPRHIVGHERPHHVALEPVLLVHHIIGDAQVLGHLARVVYIIERTAAARLGGIGDAVPASQPSLVPKLQREADHRAARMGKDRRYGRGVHPSGHGYGNGRVLHKYSYQLSAFSSQLLSYRLMLFTYSFDFEEPEATERLISILIGD